MSGVPIFPTGVVKQYNSPIPFMETIDLNQFSYETFKGSTKLRTEKYLNILQFYKLNLIQIVLKI